MSIAEITLQSNNHIVRERVQKMRAIAKQLKSEFGGIDTQIDDLIRHITPFYATPELLTRPTVVCLWGMTGVGKTHVLRRLAHLIGIEHSYAHFDMGEYTGGYSEYTLRYQLAELSDAVQDGRAMLVFDEMQTIRFVNEAGGEIDRPAARLIWDILDGAPINRNDSITNSLLDMLKQFRRLRKLGVRIHQNLVTDGLPHFKKLRRRWDRAEEKKDPMLALNDDDFETMYTCNPGYFQFNEDYTFWANKFTELDGIDGVIDFLIAALSGYQLGEPKNLSRSLIFCIGNLDEVYDSSHQANPDIDIESLRKLTEKITLSQVKEALLTRFRPEQIARLGNNHIIYPSLNRDCYWMIIDKFINQSTTRAKQFYNIDLDIDDSVRQVIFKESVFPTQGARPVNNSFGVLFDAALAEAVCELPDTQQQVRWEYLSQKRIYRFTRGSKHVDVPVRLLVESQRENDDSDQQAIVAVHEAGHAIAHLLYTGMAPKEVRSRTAGFAGGHILYDVFDHKTKKDILAEAKVTLAGTIAETLIYGAEHITNGASSDIQKMTSALRGAAGKLGMFPEDWVGYMSEQETNVINDAVHSRELSDFVQKLIAKLHHEVTYDLRQHKELLLDIAEHLMTNTILLHNDLVEMAAKYDVFERPRFSPRNQLMEILANRKS